MNKRLEDPLRGFFYLGCEGGSHAFPFEPGRVPVLATVPMWGGVMCTMRSAAGRRWAVAAGAFFALHMVA